MTPLGRSIFGYLSFSSYSETIMHAMKVTAHTARVTRDHEKALHEIRDYFVDVTGNILEKLKDLKATVSRVDHVRLYLAKGSLPPGHMEAGGGAAET